MNYFKLSFLLFSTTCHFSNAQNLSIPTVENVYGGRVLTLCSHKINSDSTRLFASTESANSVFYTDLKSIASSTSSFKNWKVIPSLDATKNIGVINNMDVHAKSGKLYYVVNENLYKTDILATSSTTIESKLIRLVKIVDDYLLYIKDNKLVVNSLDGSGNLSKISEINIPIISPNLPKLILDKDNKIVLFTDGATPSLYKFSDAIASMSASTTYSTISLSTITNPNRKWKAFGISNTGRYILGGNSIPEPASKLIAYSDDKGVTWNYYNTGISGVSGDEIFCTTVGANEYVYYSKLYNNENGNTGKWKEFGVPGGIETHPNDGCILTDPNNSSLIFVTTDQGIGASIDNGETLFEIDNGLEAVQVNDISMTTDKNTAWIASKAGIRRVTNYKTTPVWTNAMFPNGDGSPYYSVAMDPTNSDIAYVGNIRIYKTTNKGTTWTKLFDPNTKYGWLEQMYRFEAIEICPWDNNLIVAGAYHMESNNGGLFYSTDGGSTWNQHYIQATSGSYDADIYDLVFTKEAGNTILYAGVEYNSVSRSIYKLTWDNTTKKFSSSQDMDASGTAVGYPISATIIDLETTTTGDTILAIGTDVGMNHPIAYYKSISGSNKWTTLPTSGFPMTAGKVGKAITIGIDTIYAAVDNDVYIYPTSSSAWSLGYSYPKGTEINFLYYDELLVGTGTGLYGQVGKNKTTHVKIENSNSDINIFPNPTDKMLYINSESELKSIQIKDLLGKKVENFETNLTNKSINLEGLKDGIYIIEIETNTTNHSLRMIKN
jgi:hypothetical protein